MTNLFSKRFTDLLSQMDQVLSSRHQGTGMMGISTSVVDDNLLIGWKTKAKNLLEKSCGLQSQHFKQFEEVEQNQWVHSFDKAQRFKAILEAAQEDYDGGYLNDIKTIVQAEVFDSELEQAAELLKNGFKIPAAVVAGISLELTLKELCVKHGLNPGKLDRMNADLYKANIYSLLTQKRITAIAQIRNDAAHGNETAFQDADVQSMIEDVRRFVTDNT
jgi:hypothetical protein